MFRIAALLFLLSGFSAAAADDARVDRINIVKAGIMKATSPAKSIADKSISTGNRQNYDQDPHVVSETTDITVTGTTVFGIEARTIGNQTGGSVLLKAVWLYPEPGLKNPQTGAVKFRDEVYSRVKIGDVHSFYWTLSAGSAYHVPGTWTIELWQDDRRLAIQDLNVCPETSAQLDSTPSKGSAASSANTTCKQ